MLNGNKDSTNTGDQKPPLRGGLEGPKILVFDNYDSFTYNLVHLVQLTSQKRFNYEDFSIR